jgi:hypothetical protein
MVSVKETSVDESCDTTPGRQGAEGHCHTDLPPLDSPWCEICNALLTQAIVAQESRSKRSGNMKHAISISYAWHKCKIRSF